MSPLEIAEFELFTYLNTNIKPNVDELVYEKMFVFLRLYLKQQEKEIRLRSWMTEEQGQHILDMLKEVSQSQRRNNNMVNWISKSINGEEEL